MEVEGSFDFEWGCLCLIFLEGKEFWVIEVKFILVESCKICVEFIIESIIVKLNFNKYKLFLKLWLVWLNNINLIYMF